MNNTEYLLLVFGMTLVTYLPRMLPSIIIDKMRFGAGTEKFLRLIPFTAIASLIFPGVFFVDGANPLSVRPFVYPLTKSAAKVMIKNDVYNFFEKLCHAERLFSAATDFHPEL